VIVRVAFDRVEDLRRQRLLVPRLSPPAADPRLAASAAVRVGEFPQAREIRDTSSPVRPSGRVSIIRGLELLGCDEDENRDDRGNRDDGEVGRENCHDEPRGTPPAQARSRRRLHAQLIVVQLV
jgi:hypothetical protein